jgi:hypothetical protein
MQTRTSYPPSPSNRPSKKLAWLENLSGVEQ